MEISPWMAYLNLIRLSFSAGVLSIPLAISQMGLLLGPILCVGVGFLFMHTHIVLLHCLNDVARQLRIPRIAYRFGFRLALMHGPPLLHCPGRYGPNIVAICMIMSQFGICTLFVIFTSDNLKDLMDWDSNVPSLVCLYFPYVIMELLMNNIKVVRFTSMLGMLFNVIGLLLVMYEVMNGPEDPEVFWITNRPMPFLFALGILLFNMSAVGVCLASEKSLRNPKIMIEGRFSVVRVGFLAPTAVSLVMGTMGYRSFGGMEENVLRYLPYDSRVAQAAVLLFLVSVSLGYPVQAQPAATMFSDIVKSHDPLVTPSRTCIRTIEYVIRPLFVSVTFLTAYFIPYQGPFVAFIGSLCTTWLSLVFPALMEIGLRYPFCYGPYNYILVKDILIIIFGLICFVFGVFSCVHLIYIRILEHNNEVVYKL